MAKDTKTVIESSDLPEEKGVSPISRQAAFSKASSHFQKALDTVIDVMNTSKNDNARLGAARTIIDKVLPDLKAQELTGEGGGAFEVIIRNYGDKIMDEDKTVVVK